MGIFLQLGKYIDKLGFWGGKIFLTAIIIAIGYIGIKISYFIIDRIIPPKERVDRPYKTPKEARTLTILARSIVKYVASFLILGFIFHVFNIDLTPLLVSAGVVGFAIGFGAQSIIKDFIAGMSLLFEKHLSVGDYVDIGGSVGVVEEIGIRTTKIRDTTGGLHIIFNGNIRLVKNYTQANLKVKLDVFLQKKEDTPRAKKLLNEYLNDAFDYHDFRKTNIKLTPLALQSPQIIVRAEFDILPLNQQLLSQLIVPRIKELFAEQNIPLSSGRIDISYASLLLL